MPAEPPTPSGLNESSIMGKESVRVVIQTRPLLPFESAEGAVSALYAQSDPPCITVRRKSGAADVSFRSFDAVYPPIHDALPDVLYDSHITPLLTSVFSGVNATVFAYGQTSAGKSYTMRHITNRVADDLFRYKAHIEQIRPVHVSIRISFVEVYKDTIRDLVDGASAPLATVQVHVRERITPMGRVVFLDGAKERVVDSEQDLLAIIKEAALVRRTAATGMNASSSRSHSVITLSVIQEPLEDANYLSSSTSVPANSAAKILSAKLHLVDLAGSERAKRTAAAGERFAEGVQINSGLFALSKVISALAHNSERPKSKHRHVPYRDSKLTRLLQDSLGGNARTLLIACVSPADSSVEESLGTLRYAQCAKRICNKPKVNTDPAAIEVSDLRAALSRARAQISALVAENERLRGQTKPMVCSSSIQTKISPSCATTVLTHTPPTLCTSNRSPTREYALTHDAVDGSDTSGSQKQSRHTSKLHTTRSLPRFTSCTAPSSRQMRRPFVESDIELKEHVPSSPLQNVASSCRGMNLSSFPKRVKSSRMSRVAAASARDCSELVAANAVRKRARSAAPPRRAAPVAQHPIQGADVPNCGFKGKEVRSFPVRATTQGTFGKSGIGSETERPKQQGHGGWQEDRASPDDSGYSEEADSEEECDTDAGVNENTGLGRHVMSALSEARVEQMRKTFTERLEQSESDKAALDRERSRLLQEMSALREKHCREIEDLKASHVSKTAAFRAKLAGVKRLEAESLRQSKLREGSDAARKRMQGRVTAAQKAKDQAVERMSDMLSRVEQVNSNLDRENRKLAKSDRSLRNEIRRLVDDMARVEGANAKLRTENESLRGRLNNVIREPGLRRANSTVISSAHVRAAAV